MAARTRAEAIRAFLEPLRSALRCVTQSVLRERGHRYGPDQSRLLGFEGGSVRLKGTDLRLSVRISYRLVETPGERLPWTAEIVAYHYGFDDQDGKEILAYHWHPDGRVTEPHLHLGAGAVDGRLRPDLAGAHLPTRDITLQDVLRLAIAEFGVGSLRLDWEAVLHRTREAIARSID